MTDNKNLETLKRFLIENVAAKIKLEKPPGDGTVSGYELVNPAVYIGWIPPKNYLDDYGYDVPSILAMLDGGMDDNTDSVLDIRLGFATYDPGFSDQSGNMTPNTKGYQDLLNIMTLTRIEFSKVAIIGGLVSVQKPIKWGLYEEQKYPYWHGWMSFQCAMAPINYQDHGINKFL